MALTKCKHLRKREVEKRHPHSNNSTVVIYITPQDRYKCVHTMAIIFHEGKAEVDSSVYYKDGFISWTLYDLCEGCPYYEEPKRSKGKIKKSKTKLSK